MSAASSTSWLIGGLLSGLAGLLALGAYDSRPANQRGWQTSWPTSVPLAANRDSATTLMFVHPHCPCTVASVEQLLEVLKSASARATLVVYEPDSVTSDWSQGPLLQLAAEYPQQLSLVRDPQGSLAAKFGACASGTCLVYGADLRLRYAGGLTLSRGHRGDNAGQATLLRILHDPINAATAATFPIFGCSIVHADLEQE